MFWFVENDDLGFEVREFNCFEIKCGILLIICLLFNLLELVVLVILVVRFWYRICGGFMLDGMSYLVKNCLRNRGYGRFSYLCCLRCVF